MNFVELPEDIDLVCVEATSFPDGIMGAWQALHQMVPAWESRRLFGISYPDLAGKIIRNY